MLRLSYIKFMQDLQEELKKDVGLPFQVKVDVNIAIQKGNDDMKEKLENYVKFKLGPILNSIPDKVIMK